MTEVEECPICKEMQLLVMGLIASDAPLTKIFDLTNAYELHRKLFHPEKPNENPIEN